MSRQEFENHVRSARRFAWPFWLLWLLLLAIGLSGGFGVVFDQLAPMLGSLHGIPPEVAFVCMLVVVFILSPYLFIFFVSRRYRLHCPRCGPWVYHVSFPYRVLRDGACPKCHEKIVEG